ncbi:MAG: hypothetical protein QM736_03160 [Vicinamibacterales bacterium]
MRQSSGWPGTPKIGPRTVRSLYLSSTTELSIVRCSPPRDAGEFDAFNLSAVDGLAMIALSHTSRVMGFGSSCSQPLFAYRPSYTAGSGRTKSRVRCRLPALVR